MEKIRILVWDLPVRVFHWLLAISFAGAYLTSGYDRLRYVHVTLGYTVAVLIVFRLAWAIIGTRHARLSSFSYGPRAVREYLGSLLARNPRHYVGHNPAGSWAIYAILTLGIVTTGTGYARYGHLVGKWINDVHQVAGNLFLAVVIAHIAGVVVSSFLHRENLAKAMVTGYKAGPPGEAIPATRLGDRDPAGRLRCRVLERRHRNPGSDPESRHVRDGRCRCAAEAPGIGARRARRRAA